MKYLTYLLAIGVALSSAATLAAEPLLGSDNDLKPLLGKRIMAEGLAWGEGAKGLGERVVLPTGTPLYFTGAKYRERHRNGRTIRVAGVLTIKKMSKAPPGAQGYGNDFNYYSLEVETIEVIDKVDLAFPAARESNEGQN